MWDKVFKHLRESLSEDGIGSYSRLSGFISIVFSVIWISYLVLKNHALPDLGGVTGFVAGANAPYGANQAKKVAAAIKGNVNNPVPPVDQNIPPDGQNG